MLFTYRITEAYIICIENYNQFELKILEEAVKSLSYNTYNHSSSLIKRASLQAPLIGYLSGARGFIDSSHHLLKKISKREFYESYSNLSHWIYDNDIYYAFAEALRNYTQHTGLPLHKVVYNFRAPPPPPHNTGHSSNEYSMDLWIDKQALMESGSFKKKALNEMPSNINLTLAIRHHMSGIGTLHNYIVSSFMETVKECTKLHEEAHHQYSSQTHAEPIGLSVYHKNSDGITTMGFSIAAHLGNEWLSTSKSLGNMIDLQSRHVSSRTSNPSRV